MDKLLERLNRSEEFKRYLSPTLEELFNSCVQLEKYYDQFRLMSSHDLLPTIDMIWETITLADRIRGIVKMLIEKESQKQQSKIPPNAYNTWKDSWAKFEKRLEELKMNITNVAIGGKQAVKLKIFSFIADYVSFIRANVYPVFKSYANVISVYPEQIFGTIESKFAVMFIRRFTKTIIKEEEE